MCSDKIQGRKDAGRRNQHKEASNTQPLMEQQQHQHPAIHAGVSGGANNSHWHLPADPQASFHGSSHPARNVTFLPSPLPTLLLALVICCCQKKEESRTHMCFSCWVRELNLLTEGPAKPQGQDEVWGGSWQLQGMKCRRPRRRSPSPPDIRSPLAIFHILLVRSWTDWYRGTRTTIDEHCLHGAFNTPRDQWKIFQPQPCQIMLAAVTEA